MTIASLMSPISSSNITNSNYQPDKYRALNGKVQQQKTIYWPAFQYRFMKLHSAEICQTKTQKSINRMYISD